MELADWGQPIDDPVQFYDHPSQGIRVTVGDVAAVFNQEQVAADRLRLTWKIGLPGVFGNWVQIDADIRGPREAALRQQVEAMLASFRFSPPPDHVSEDAAVGRAVAAAAVAALRDREPAAYACFPGEPGTSRTATVLSLPIYAPLSKPLPATCSMSIAATDVGYWRMVLVIKWTAAADRSAGSVTYVQWLLPDGRLSAGTGSGSPPDSY